MEKSKFYETNYMNDIITFNHISEKLTKVEQEELIAYYKTYHRKAWAFKKHYKHYKRLRFIANATSIIIASSSIVSAIVTAGIPLISISMLTILIQSYVKYKDYDFKINSSKNAFQSYSHLLSEIKNILRSGNYNKDMLLSHMYNIDNFIIDNTSIIDKWLREYDESTN